MWIKTTYNLLIDDIIHYMKIITSKRGFTIIELLVVIAIIGILTAIITANFTQAKAKARDTKRISDLANMQLALELYFDRCNRYPVATANSLPDLNDTTVCLTALNNFISKIPTGPNVNESYTYFIDASTYDYRLRAILETNSSALQESVKTDIGSSGCTTTSFTYCVGPK